MNVPPWLPLDALQAGALFALALGYLADAAARRDRLMGWLGLTCVIIGIRHGVMVMAAEEALSLQLTDRLQSLCASIGFFGLACAFRVVFPRQFTPRAVALLALGMAPNLVRNLTLPRDIPAEHVLHQITNAAYVLGAAFICLASWRASQEGSPMARRLLWGIVGLCVPVVVEAGALTLFGAKIRLSGLALMILAIAIGGSWLHLTMQGQREQLERCREETKAWRSLVPGPTWHSAEPSLLMESLFGLDWPRRLEDRMESGDGSAFELHRVGLSGGASLGWIETRVDTLPGTARFLTGWTVALGMDDGPAFEQARAWLESWGAEVAAWGTVPPREGPYPSFLVWAREPSILAVWREDALDRRRPRWIQVGGPQTEGPHARLEKPLDEISLRLALQRLLSVK
jgi:hypothetical protein